MTENEWRKEVSLVRTTNTYKCDNCGKEETWNKGWLHKLIPRKREQYDENVTVCCEKCAMEYDKKRKHDN